MHQLDTNTLLGSLDCTYLVSYFHFWRPQLPSWFQANHLFFKQIVEVRFNDSRMKKKP
jgi:hypothetical protein